MEYLKVTKQFPENYWIKVEKLGTEEDDSYGNKVFKVRVDGKEKLWSVKPTSKAFTNFSRLDIAAVKWFQGDQWPATVVADPQDAKVKSEILNQGERPKAKVKTEVKVDDTVKDIRFGLSMNCASRLAAALCGTDRDWETDFTLVS